MASSHNKDKLKDKTTTSILEKALGTGEVDTLCRKAVANCQPRVKFLGVGAAHSLPKMSLLVEEKKMPCCFVANTQTKEKDGEHWVAFYFPPGGGGGRGEGEGIRRPFMFDSYGRAPKGLGHPDWAEYMTTAALKRKQKEDPEDGVLWDRQHHIVQRSDSSVCGVLCAYFLWHAVRGMDPFPKAGIVPASKLRSFVEHIKG